MVTPMTVVSLFKKLAGITRDEPTGMEVNVASPPLLAGWGVENPKP